MTAPPIPAATLILFRASPEGTQHLFVERATTMTFAAGAIVFPGGRVDPDDHALATRFPKIHPDDAAARIAAIRETIEETGHAVGLAGTLDATKVGHVRAGLAAGTAFSALIGTYDMALDLDALVPFARWCPRLHQARNFDTRFYIARADDHQTEISVDATENVRLFWETPQRVVDCADRGDVLIIFPTRRNLERLAMLSGYDDALAHAARYPPELIEPWIESGPEGDRIHIPTDRGYPVTWEPLTAAVRG